MAQKGKGRKFFQQMQPTFSIDLPHTTTTTLEFLDHSDPAKDAVVRKKAREWVNKNREISRQGHSGRAQRKATRLSREEDKPDKSEDQQQLVRIKSEESVASLSPLLAASLESFDPFNLFPDVGRKYEHVIQFFLTACPEEIPCSDDKYSDKSKHSLIPFSSDNTVLGNMAKSKLTFILWLFATVSIRDSMGGNVDTEEVHWFCNQSLKAMQETLKREVVAGEYSDHLVNAMACITATASFSGMFKTAELHRDALIRVLGLRGDGDVVKGLQCAAPWTIKAVQWCEIMVATQLVETPRIPYLAQVTSESVPNNVIEEATRLTLQSISKLPPLTQRFQYILCQLHLIGTAYAQKHQEVKIDYYVIGPLYDAECALLQSLQEQKQPIHEYSDVEVLLSETFQLYFWTGPRMLPPQTRLCDLLISRIMRALLPLLLEAIPEVDLEYVPETAASVLHSMANWVSRSFHHPRNTNNAIIWSLALGTMVSATLLRPEHSWFKEHFRMQMQHMGLDRSEEEFHELLEIFPTTEGFGGINLKTMWEQYKV